MTSLEVEIIHINTGALQKFTVEVGTVFEVDKWPCELYATTVEDIAPIHAGFDVHVRYFKPGEERSMFAGQRVAEHSVPGARVESAVHLYIGTALGFYLVPNEHYGRAKRIFPDNRGQA